MSWECGDVVAAEIPLTQKVMGHLTQIVILSGEDFHT